MIKFDQNNPYFLLFTNQRLIKLFSHHIKHFNAQNLSKDDSEYEHSDRRQKRKIHPDKSNSL